VKNYLLCFFVLSAAMMLLPRAATLFPQEEEPPFLTVLDTQSGETFPLPLEDYVIGVMETLSLPPEAEARKAIAVAIRSRAVYCKEHTPVHKNAALCNDPACCLGFEAKDFSSENIAAAAETAGQYLAYQGHPAAALFHESSGKFTASAFSVYGVEVPYLQGVKNVEEGVTEAFSFPTEKFLSLLGISQRVAVEDLFWGYDRFGRVQMLEWEGGSLGGAQVQTLLELPSTCFTLSLGVERVHILCHGRGDGVGLSLNGASILAREGKGYAEILAFYFPKLPLET
jgi:stage II sporulation protein D